MIKSKAQEEAFHKAAKAIAKFITTLGGNASIVSGTSIRTCPGDADHKYFIQFTILGKKPVLKKSK